MKYTLSYYSNIGKYIQINLDRKTSDNIGQKKENDDLPFRKPDFEIDNSNTQYSKKKQTTSYKNVTKERLISYVDLLVSDGFTQTKLEESPYIDNSTGYYLKKDNLYIYIWVKSYKESLQNTGTSCYISYTKGSSSVRSNAISCDEAKTLIGINNKIVIEIYVPDLYEKMQAQLFITTKDCMYYIIRNKKVYHFTSSSFNPADGNLSWSHSNIDNYIVCDINKDNVYELLYETMGTTSGIYSERIAAVNFTNDKPIIKYSSNIAFIPNNSISIIKQTDSEVFICYRQPGKDESGSASSVLVLKKVKIEEDKINLTDID
jgi:hypothetical protein